MQLTKLSTAEEKVEYADLRKAFARSQASSSRQVDTSTPVNHAISVIVSSSSSTSMDESFYIPPASQLDASVFEALPEHYKVKIFESYAREKAIRTPAILPKHKETPTVVQSTVQETKTVVNTHGDDAVDVMTVFAYLREWLQHSGEDGPTNSDVQSFSDYVISLLDNHMDVVY